MLIRAAIVATVLAGLGMVDRALGAESEAPPPREGAFERLDQNHDGVIQREEFEQARGRRDGQRRQELGDRGPRGDRGRRGPRGGDGPRGIFRDGGPFERQIDEAIDRAMKRAEGDPEKLRRALHDELSQELRKGRGRAGQADAPLSAPEAERWDHRRGAPPDDARPGERARGFGERRRFPGGPPRGNPEERAKRIMDRFDGNDDGVLSAEELEGRRAERWLRADADGDGRVDQAELLTMLHKVGEGEGRIGRRGPKEPDAPPPPPGE
ncbi:MAG TPA: hypothetical protein VJZ71_01880 [Phycisphaerae bacterium]|nr:hypothetical protein [Phycisphaerae bacterium]